VWVIKHAARRAKWLDQSQSVNLFTRSQSGKELSDIYLDAWRMGLKTTYYLRTLGATGIEKSTIGLKEQAVNGNGNGHAHSNGELKATNGKSEHADGNGRSKNVDVVAKTTDKTMCLLGDEDCEACQ
jgi:ribonucleoside-diphosphate reductase alpha chain